MFKKYNKSQLLGIKTSNYHSAQRYEGVPYKTQ